MFSANYRYGLFSTEALISRFSYCTVVANRTNCVPSKQIKKVAFYRKCHEKLLEN
jgi:hypothetical protein